MRAAVAAAAAAVIVMPYRITWEPRGVYREYFGDVTVADRLASFERTCFDRRFEGLAYMIVDYLGARSVEIRPRATEEIAAFYADPLWNSPGLLIAIVSDRDDIQAAALRFLAQGFFAAPSRTFATLAQAREWTGSSAPASPPSVPALSGVARAAPPGDLKFDRPLQPHEALLLARLSAAELAAMDASLLEAAPSSWCRSAVVVARAFRAGSHRRPLPPTCYAERLVRLAADGRVEVRGDLRRSRECLVRRPDGC